MTKEHLLCVNRFSDDGHFYVYTTLSRSRNCDEPYFDEFGLNASVISTNFVGIFGIFCKSKIDIFVTNEKNDFT